MNIDSDALSETISDASPIERYIILINNTLRERNQEHVLTIDRMENNLNELYKSLTKADSRIEDLHEIEANLRELSEKYAKVIETTRTELKNYKIKAKTHLRYLQIIMIVFSSFYYEFYGFNTFAPVGMMLIVITAFQESTLNGMVNQSG